MAVRVEEHTRMVCERCNINYDYMKECGLELSDIDGVPK